MTHAMGACEMCLPEAHEREGTTVRCDIYKFKGSASNALSFSRG